MHPRPPLPSRSGKILIDGVAVLVNAQAFTSAHIPHVRERPRKRLHALRCSALDAVPLVLGETVPPHLLKPAPAVLLYDVLGRLSDGQPGQGPGDKADAQDQGDGLQDALMPLHHHVLAGQDADHDACDAAPQVGSVACAVRAQGGHVGDDVDGAQDEEEDQGGLAELLLTPIDDEVGELHADQGVAAPRHADHGLVRVPDDVAHGSAEDADVVHEEHPQVAVQGFQRDAQDAVHEHVHADVRDADVRELVGQVAPDLAAQVLARTAEDPEVGPTF
mmetsp:Transcript_70585/g.228627  ORF Transcript_70585/g.228627 Transcript_70585/m.228627 type:complete len:276 (+) Transcript_70585:173-1000(+)